MKRIGIAFLAAALLLAGCAGSDGGRNPNWDESWVPIGADLAAETPDGFTLNESNDVLSISGLYYVTWTCGQGRGFVNSEDEEATVYDAQIYVLLKECADGAEAERNVDEWIAREKQSYETGEAERVTVASQEFQMLPLLNGNEANPYPHGTAAFAVRGQNAISVELVCSERFTGDSRAVLERFLAGFHYAEEQEG